MKYPKIFKETVNITKINKPYIKLVITKQLQPIVPDDDVLVNYIYELMVQDEEPNIKHIYSQLVEFLNDDAMEFCKQLWLALLHKQHQSPPTHPSPSPPTHPSPSPTTYNAAKRFVNN